MTVYSPCSSVGRQARSWRSFGVSAYLYGVSPGNIAAPNEAGSIEDFPQMVRVYTLAAARYFKV